MNEQGALWRYLYPLLASLAGAIAALSLQSWKEMSNGQITLFVIAGTGFGFFVFPLVFKGVDNPQVAGAVCFLMASAWNGLLPLFIRKFFSMEETRK